MRDPLAGVWDALLLPLLSGNQRLENQDMFGFVRGDQ
jgi:hypothetical protein